MTVPFYSIKKTWPRLRPVVEQRLRAITDNGNLSNGRTVRELEGTLRRYCGARHAVAVSNGTDALILMLQAAGIGPGDEVIVPCYTFVASATSVAHVGATPVFVDIDPQTYALDPAALTSRITPRTKAIMPVHLFSQLADMPAVLEVAERFGLQVLEDSAEAIGMRCQGRHAGLLGRAGVLSFFPTKTLGALGDAGLILTDDNELASRCRLLRDHGRPEGDPDTVLLPGHNARMDELQAAILLARLERLDEEIAHRAALAGFYDEHLADLTPRVVLPRFPARSYATNQVFYVYLIEAEGRDELAAFLNGRGIGTEVYYPTPLHLQPCFAHLGYQRGEFPHAERASGRALALPLYADLSLAEADKVCQAILSFYETR